MRWTQAEYAAYQARSNEARRKASRPVPEQVVRHESVAAKKRADRLSHRIVVSITSFRRRLLDPDNCTGGAKHFIDGLRHAGLIPDDRPQDIELKVSQVKVKTKELERTEIEIV